MHSTTQQELLHQIRRQLPHSKEWEKWLATTGELPPDFSTLATNPTLPDPLQSKATSTYITTPELWQDQRSTILHLFQHWILGHVPPPPDNLSITYIDEHKARGASIKKVRLSFGKQQQAILHLELFIPDGSGPFPVFLTQHNHRSWALIAVSRGYIGCVYAGADSQDDTDTFLSTYPTYDWSRLTRRAWAASRCVDYLSTLPIVNAKQIAITGHSRNGKQALIAMAMDQRISLVIASSAGIGGTVPFRYSNEQNFSEGIEAITRVFPDWFHPRLRFFSGREDALPIDMHELVALSAPRPCLLSDALNDGCVNTWALQQSYKEAQRVYQILQAEDKLRILWRPGGHETGIEDIERYLDWCDTHFDRAHYTFPEHFIYPQDIPYRKDEASPVLPEQSETLQQRVRWMLGEAPPAINISADSYGIDPQHVSVLLGRSKYDTAIERQQLVFGDYISADVYLPAGIKASGEKVAAILWLAPFASPTGYRAAYLRGDQIFHALAKAGFAVFCFDPIGSGRRITEIHSFYKRHPEWSLIGKMVQDAQAAVEVMSTLPYIDAQQIYGLGYSVGSLVGLHLASLEERLAGLAVIAPPAPFRTDATTKAIWRWTQHTGLLPRLNAFADSQTQLPYDIEDLYASLVPRPLLIISPQLDRMAPLQSVQSAFEHTQQAFHRHNAHKKLCIVTPETHHQLAPEFHAIIAQWLREQRVL